MRLTPSKHDRLIQQIGAFLLPIYPLLLLSALNAAHPYVAGIGEVSLLFAIGLGINFTLLVAHEMGHAIVARIAGFEVVQVVIGSGRQMASWKLGITTIGLRLVPSAGFVALKPCPNQFSARHIAPFYAAGLAAELLVAGSAYVLLPPPALETETFGAYALAFVRLSLLIFMAIHLAENLWPRDAVICDRPLPTDGKQLWMLWKHRSELEPKKVQFSEFLALDRLAASRDFSGALAMAATLRIKYPAHPILPKCIGSYHQELGENDAARANYEQALALVPQPPAVRAAMLDALASHILANPNSALLADAERWSCEALECNPTAITLKGTRGSVLIALGRFGEGRPLLEEVIRESSAPHDQAISRAYLARAAFLEGDHAKALALFAEIRALKIEHELITLVEKELRAAGLEIPA